MLLFLMTFRNLGVTMDSDFTFEEHINNKTLIKTFSKH